MTNFRHVLSVGLAAATLAVVLTYVLAGQALLQSPYAEPGHELFMSMYMPLIQGITGSHGSMSQMHGGPATMPAGGLAAAVVMGAITLAAGAFVVSWKQRSFVVAGLLAASGIILVILPLANMNFVFPGPILGVIFGLAIFGLGVAKAIRTVRTAVVATR